MSLSEGKLEGGLARDYFTQGSCEFVEPALRFASVYARYAKDARSCQGQGPAPGTIEAAQLKLGGYLAAQLPRSRNPLQFCNIFATGLSAFWLLPPVAFLGGTPGAVTLANPATLQASLLKVCATAALEGAAGHLTPPKVARMWAQAIHAWTRTVVVLHGPPSGCTAGLT
jgi:hypothetical protein